MSFTASLTRICRWICNRPGTASDKFQQEFSLIALKLTSPPYAHIFRDSMSLRGKLERAARASTYPSEALLSAVAGEVKKEKFRIRCLNQQHTPEECALEDIVTSLFWLSREASNAARDQSDKRAELLWRIMQATPFTLGWLISPAVPCVYLVGLGTLAAMRPAARLPPMLGMFLSMLGFNGAVAAILAYFHLIPL